MYENDDDKFSYNLDKIIRIGPSNRRGVKDGILVYQHEVWFEGLPDPVWLDFRVVEAISELHGSVVASPPGYCVIDFEHDVGNPEKIPIIAWRVSKHSYERTTPVTLNGNNNGQPGVSWPILTPAGTVDDWDRSFSTLAECIATRKSESANG